MVGGAGQPVDQGYGIVCDLDGQPLGAEERFVPWELTWDTRTATNGPHTLTAVARDAAGNRTTSAPVPVTVANGDLTPPTVSLVTPTSGSPVAGPITVAASASDNMGIVGVQFRLDGATLGAEDTTSPYSLSWNTTAVANGPHTVTATARDAAGNTTTSSSVTVTVANGGP